MELICNADYRLNYTDFPKIGQARFQEGIKLPPNSDEGVANTMIILEEGDVGFKTTLHPMSPV